MTKTRIGAVTFVATVGAFLFFAIPSAKTQEIHNRKSAAIGQPMGQFSISDYRGRVWNSKELAKSKAIAIVFLGVECPIVKLYASKLNQIQKEYSDRGLSVIAINSNSHDSISELENFARTNDITFPILKDVGNRFADQIGAERTPQVFLFDSQRKLRYFGRIDDKYTYGRVRKDANNNYLTDAIDSILSGQAITLPSTEAVGCIIGRVVKTKPTGQITFTKHISRILQRNCTSCHRPGEIAPFSLTDYNEVVGWAEMIQEVIKERRMPPWHANPKHGTFKNDSRMSSADQKTIHQWIANGVPEGDPADMPAPKQFATGWQMGTPDFVLQIDVRPFKVAATGVLPYKYFVVDPGFTEDKWIKAAECRAGNRSVVHHIIVGIEGDSQKVHGAVDSEWITAAAPGSPPMILPDGYAKLIPAGSKIVFQMHYTPNGTATTDLSKVGFIFADPDKVKKVVGTREVINTKFRIPARDSNYEVRAETTFDNDILMLSMFPHMHLRGKSFQYIAHFPDGSKDVLLDVPNYDFNWQNGYVFEQAKLIPAGTKLECIAHFDNSENNFANPNPGKIVRWGDQTFEEMMIGYFDMVLADQDLLSDNNARTAKFLAKLDQNNDAIITEELLSLAATALQKPGLMNRFGSATRKTFPQIDRVCWTSLVGGEIKVERVCQSKPLTATLGGEGVSTSSKNCKIREISQAGKPENLISIGALGFEDMKFMGSKLNSSFHVPVTIKGTKGTINFWSIERDGFPKRAQNGLIQLAHQMACDSDAPNEK